MDLSIIVAYRGDDGLRTRQMKWTVRRYREMFPEAEVILSEDKSDQGWTSFCKSKYINLGVKRSTRSVLLITDIDVVLPRGSILKAVKALDKNCLVVPYNLLYKLSSSSSERILGNLPTKRMPNVPLSLQTAVSLTKRWHPQGISVITRENFDLAGGYDERFVGWGSEDSAFQSAVNTMCEGGFLQLEGIAYHLKHPIVKDRHLLRDQRVGDLVEAYTAARHNKEAMKKIIDGRSQQ